MSAAQSAKRTQPGKVYAKKTSRQSAAKRSKKVKAVKKASTRRIIIALVGIAAIIMLTIGGFMANRMLERRTYKLIYVDEILACADEFSLDPCLVAAVIHTESSNRAAVVSPKGAIGLMQIMPSTGEWIAGKLGMADYSEEKLMEPLIISALAAGTLDIYQINTVEWNARRFQHTMQARATWTNG